MKRDILDTLLGTVMGMLIGGALVFGMTSRELAETKQKAETACHLAVLAITTGEVEARINFSIKEQLAACRGWAPPLEPISGARPTPPR